MATALWSPNQASVAQVETYTFTTPSGIGNTYVATYNGKTVTYSSVSGDTATTAATALFTLLNANPLPFPELGDITFTNPSAGVMVATASTPGTPFANVLGTSAGLVLSTGNGLVNGIATVHTQANLSPSDVFDLQNWLRVTGSAPGVRALPINGDDLVIANTSIPLLWNLDQLKTIQFNTYTRWNNFTGTIGLPEVNAKGYTEWRATDFWFVGPTGSTPAGGLVMLLGYGSGGGPTRERYNLQSQKYTCRAIAAGSPADDYGIRLLGVHTDNVIYAEGGVSIGVATSPGQVSSLNTVITDGSSTVGIGLGVTWTTSTSGTASSCTAYGGTLTLNTSPATLTLNNGCQASFNTDGITWASIIAQGGSTLTWLAGGTITSLTLSNGSNLDKSADARTLTITNCTLDGDTCQINDPVNAVVFTNAASVKQQVTSGPFLFTGTRTVKVT